MNALRDRLAALSTRERLILGAGALAAAAIVLYAFAWQPWQSELARLRAQVPAKAADLAWMKARAAEAERLAGEADDAAPQDAGLPLLTLMERSAERAGIRDAISRMGPGDNDREVRIWMDEAGFDRWLQWLSRLQAAGVHVAEASIDGTGTNRVAVRATLAR